MFSRLDCFSSPLRKNVGFKRLHLWVVVGQLLTFERVLDTPVDHVAQQGHLFELGLKLRIGFRSVLEALGWHMSCSDFSHGL